MTLLAQAFAAAGINPRQFKKASPLQIIPRTLSCPIVIETGSRFQGGRKIRAMKKVQPVKYLTRINGKQVVVTESGDIWEDFKDEGNNFLRSHG